MSVFDLSQTLESINAGTERYSVTQVYPISGNINGAYVGTGQASGLSTFQFGDSVDWWSPSMSYFLLRLKFVKFRNSAVEKVIEPTDAVAYADNFVSTLFTQIKTQINSRQLDIIDVPWIIDTALSYSNAKAGFLGSFASMSHLGEPLMTRIDNICNSNGYIEVAFRPPVSLFNAKLLPPGASFRLDFNWAGSARAAFEALNGDITIGTTSTADTLVGTTYNVSVESFSMYKATLSPSQLVSLPEKGVIDLTPCISNQYFLNGGANLKQNITLPSTTNRILVVLQDTNSSSLTVNGFTQTPGVGTGYNPVTSFAYAVSSGQSYTTTVNGQSVTYPANTPFAVPVKNVYLTLPELGIQMPQPTYEFSGDMQDWVRAYADWANVCQGTIEQNEGSVPLGTFNTSLGATITYIGSTVANSIMQAGDIGNPQRFVLAGNNADAIPAAPGTITKSTYNQTARYGYLGRCPGPILAFPVVRPENKSVSVGTLNITFPAQVASCVATVLCSYSMALALEHAGNGLYSYQLVEGV